MNCSEHVMHMHTLTSERWSTCWFLIRCLSPRSWLPCSAAAEPQPAVDSHCHGTSLERRGRTGGGEGGDVKRDSRSLTYSVVTYGDKSDVKLMIGVDAEREKKQEETDRRNVQRHQQRVTLTVNEIDSILWTECVAVKGERSAINKVDKKVSVWLCRVLGAAD